MSLVVGRCNHFVTRKKRFCRMSVRTGASFCGEHEPKIDSDGPSKQNESALRMTCPLDPKHTCYISKLEKHLKVCNAKQGVLPSYIRKNCNVATSGQHVTNAGNGSVKNIAIAEDGTPKYIAIAEDGNRRSLANVSDEVLRQVVTIVEQLFDGIISGNISTCEQRPCHAAVACDLDTDGRGDNTRRHLLQTSSLIHVLQGRGLATPGTCFVELGAGKGHLSYYLSKAVDHLPACSVLLVDRASHRHKQDNKLLKEATTTTTVVRIRADISDLVLNNVPAVMEAKSVVAVSKHLCGVATDLALNCVTKDDILEKTTGLVMATCCHHRCVWDSYVGRPFLEDNKVSHSQFDVICGLVSWATCGTGLSRKRREQINDTKQAKKSKSQIGNENSDTLKDEVNQSDNVESATNSKHEDIIINTVKGSENIEDMVETNENLDDSITIEEKSEDNSSSKETYYDLKDEVKQSDNVESAINSKHTIEDIKVKGSENIEDTVETEEKSEDNGSSKETYYGEEIDDDDSGSEDEKDFDKSEGRNNDKYHVSITKHLGLSLKQREEIGFKAKAILDWGRLLYLRGKNFDTNLCFYVDKSLSPENVCIVSKKISS